MALDTDDFMEQFPHYERYEEDLPKADWWGMMPAHMASGGKVSMDDLTGRNSLIDGPREFRQNMADSISSRVAKTMEIVKKLGHKYKPGDYVHTEWTAKNGHPPYRIEHKTKNSIDWEMEGARHKKDANGQKIHRAPVPAYHVSQAVGVDDQGKPLVNKFILEEQHIKGPADPSEFAKGGPVKMAMGGLPPHTPSASMLGRQMGMPAMRPGVPVMQPGVARPGVPTIPGMMPNRMPARMADGGAAPQIHQQLQRIPAQLLGTALPGGPVGYQPRTTLLQNAALSEHLKNLVAAMQAEHQAEQAQAQPNRP